MSRYICYYRVSTQKQGRSGLGLEAQRAMCRAFVDSRGGAIIHEYKDVESGKKRDRAGLWAAIEHAQKEDIPLVIAKLDRLARDVEFTFKVMNTGIDIYFCDMPVVNTMVLGVFAAVAQYERELISQRTKAALEAKRARGETWVRNTDTSAAVQASAKNRTDDYVRYMTTEAMPQYVKMRYEQGWKFYDILEDAIKMYKVQPDVYCTRKGAMMSKGVLSKWINFFKDNN